MLKFVSTSRRAVTQTRLTFVPPLAQFPRVWRFCPRPTFETNDDGGLGLVLQVDSGTFRRVGFALRARVSYPQPVVPDHPTTSAEIPEYL